jgi:hypothetical protein
MEEAAEHQVNLKTDTEIDTQEQADANCYRVGEVLERDRLVH